MISVIVAVYNHFGWLRLVLDALRMQTVSGFEVVIADDGSGPEAVAAIKAYMDSHPELNIKHSWIPDRGWRKNMSLNAAVRAASGDYLVFIDGDCIPHPRFVEDHGRMRLRGTVTGGRRVEMSPRVSAMVEGWESLPEGYFGRVRAAALRYAASEGLGTAFSQLKRAVRLPLVCGHPVGARDSGFLGANFGIYREDLERVNGFDERYLAPATGEDTDLDERLANAGIHHRKVSRHALMLHRCHPRLPFDSPDNARLIAAVRADGTTWVDEGLYRDRRPPQSAR